MCDDEQTIDQMRKLQWRLNTAIERLQGLIDSGQGYDEARLRGKHEGVRLAESYVAEIVRTTPPTVDPRTTARDETRTP